MSIKREIFEYLVDHLERWHFVPDQQETRRMFAGRCDDVDLHLEQLVREGLISIGGNGAGAITLPPTYAPVPRLGVRSSGPREKDDSAELVTSGTIALDLSGVGVAMPQGLDGLVVLDQSMIDAGIEQGDIALLEHRPPQRGEVVALCLGTQVLLRRLVVIQGIPHFLAENATRPDLVPAFDLPTQGVLWGLIRPKSCRANASPALPSPVSYQRDGGLAVESTSELARELEATLSRRIAKCGARPGRSKAAPADVPKKCRPAKAMAATEWPRKPSGHELNDGPDSRYRAEVVKPILDERPCRRYHDAHVTALEEFSRWQNR